MTLLRYIASRWGYNKFVLSSIYSPKPDGLKFCISATGPLNPNPLGGKITANAIII